MRADVPRRQRLGEVGELSGVRGVALRKHAAHGQEAGQRELVEHVVQLVERLRAAGAGADRRVEQDAPRRGRPAQRGRRQALQGGLVLQELPRAAEPRRAGHPGLAPPAAGLERHGAVLRGGQRHRGIQPHAVPQAAAAGRRRRHADAVAQLRQHPPPVRVDLDVEHAEGAARRQLHPQLHVSVVLGLEARQGDGRQLVTCAAPRERTAGPVALCAAGGCLGRVGPGEHQPAQRLHRAQLPLGRHAQGAAVG
mmetsp:Transcript_24599/g.63913  ORF Transcript_24599/g.63913 Transcript_24599/m.63913 type:complete len:252 (-) Transcript_24599:24-779(-)